MSGDTYQPLNASGIPRGGRVQSREGAPPGAPVEASYFTATDETAALPDSRRLTARGVFSVPLTGFGAPIISTWEWWLIGGELAILRATGSGVAQSNADILEMPAGTLPAAIRPEGAAALACPLLDASLPRIGRADVASRGASGEGGIFFATPNANGAVLADGFTPSGLKGIVLGTVLSWPVT